MTTRTSKNSKVAKAVSDYMARIGALGGKAGTGAVKARPMTRAKARAMAKARWRVVCEVKAGNPDAKVRITT